MTKTNSDHSFFLIMKSLSLNFECAAIGACTKNYFFIIISILLSSSQKCLKDMSQCSSFTKQEVTLVNRTPISSKNR